MSQGPARTPGHDRRGGRPYDHSGDPRVLATTLDLLAERDYERVTLNDIAARAGMAKTTVYRRWATKEDLVIAAVRDAGRPAEADALPDLGSLRADLLAVVDSPWLGGTDRRLAILGNLVRAMRDSSRLGEVVRSGVSEPYVEVYRRVLLRAVERQEIPAACAAAIPLLAETIPALSTHRLNTGREPVDRSFFVDVIDRVILPALGRV